MRIAPQTRERLEAEAVKTGRSITQEAELRLEQSFTADRLVVDAMVLLYGRQIAGLMLEFADLLSETGRTVGYDDTRTLEGAENWLSQPRAYDEALEAVTTLLEAFRPAGEIVRGAQSSGVQSFWIGDANPELQRVLDEAKQKPGEGIARAHIELLLGNLEIGGIAGEKVALKQELLGDLIDHLRQKLPDAAKGNSQ